MGGWREKRAFMTQGKAKAWRRAGHEGDLSTQAVSAAQACHTTSREPCARTAERAPRAGSGRGVFRLRSHVIATTVTLYTEGNGTARPRDFPKVTVLVL